MVTAVGNFEQLRTLVWGVLLTGEKKCWQIFEFLWKKKSLKQSWLPAFWKEIQNTQEIKRMLFNETKQDKICKFWRKSWFSSYVQQYNKIFSPPPLIAYKRDTNIRHMLVQSKLRQPATRTPGTTPCNKRNAKRVPPSAPRSASKDRSPRWASPNSSAARRTKSCTIFIAPNTPNSTLAKWDAPSTPASRNTWLT